MSDDKDYFKLITGKTLEEATRIPSLEETITKQFKQHRSKQPLRTIGVGQESIFISEEEREANIHVIGAPGEGKSKFLEDQIRKDIDAGQSVCLLDGSDAGDTCYNILEYCASIGHKKVVLIDPKMLSKYGKVASIRLLDPKYPKESIQGVFEAVNILFGRVSETATPRLKRRLEGLIKVLMNNGFSFSDTEPFSEYRDNEWKDILDRCNESRDKRFIISEYRSEAHFDNWFSSTINSLAPFWEEPLKTMFGYTHGVDFRKMISKGWVVLVNASPGGGLTKTESQLLGIVIISQMINAAEILFESYPERTIKKICYLYVDEVGRFATEQIDTVLSHSRKTGLRLILAHQYFKQIQNEKVRNSIEQSARIKVMFNTPGYDDRLLMSKLLGYGGDIKPIDASFANQDLARRYAIIKKNKESPRRVRIPDVEPVGKVDLDLYIKELLKDEWYVPKRETTTYTRPIESRTETNSRAGGKTGVSDKGSVGSKWKAISKNLPVSKKHADENDKEKGN